MIKTGKVLEIEGKNAVVLVDGTEKRIRIDDEVKKGETVNVFQNLGFK